MSFCIDVGTDLYGMKRNVRLTFAGCPTMSELINAVESHYDVEARSTRPAGYPDVPFKIETMQVYDEILLRWVDLYASSQLSNNGQVFCFQPESIWHSDSQDIIPDAQAGAVTWTTPVGSPRRYRIAADAGVAPALSEKLRSVFYDIDTGGKGYVLYTDLRAAFQKCDIDFAYATVGELFTQADRNRSGHVTFDEWVHFAISHPQVIDALFFRHRDMYQDRTALLPPPSVAAAASAAAAAAEAEASAARARRQAELRSMYEEQWAATERARLAGEYESAKREADSARVQKELAESKERLAWDRLYYSPSSPRRFF
eukprot:TRINITY_DN348_c0_g1_i2.p2 TRINITY_DN348_c0_g1~~TRINITY_DN348_c0_g1_i2.p2  ORF type:complete len:315 (+),score=135.69 TRINITY_DN348_c0_g1_i2:136-1080(+)